MRSDFHFLFSRFLFVKIRNRFDSENFFMDFVEYLFQISRVLCRSIERVFFFETIPQNIPCIILGLIFWMFLEELVKNFSCFLLICSSPELVLPYKSHVLRHYIEHFLESIDILCFILIEDFLLLW